MINKSQEPLYDNAAHIFYDLYFGNGVKHNDKPDKHFAQGDIVTTNCDWDLGIVDYIINGKLTIFGRDNGQYNINSVDFYKTGVSIRLDE